MLTFPTGLFAPAGLTPRSAGASTSGGSSVAGIPQLAHTSGGGLHIIEFSNVVLWDADKYKTWRAFQLASDNGATPFIVPLCDRRSQPFLDPKKEPGTGNSDSSTFSDGALWGSGQITAAIIGSAALRATSAHIACIGGTTNLIGSAFTIIHIAMGTRLYLVTSVSEREDGTFDIKFRPPLREATPDGVTLDFDDPRCQMCVSPDSDPAPTLEMLKRGSAQVKFIENFRPVTDD